MTYRTAVLNPRNPKNKECICFPVDGLCHPWRGEFRLPGLRLGGSDWAAAVDCGVCAISLDRIARQETALVKGCDHAYWSVANFPTPSPLPPDYYGYMSVVLNLNCIASDNHLYIFILVSFIGVCP